MISENTPLMSGETEMKVSYKAAIEILTSTPPIDYRAVCIELAKENPEEFVKACGRLPVETNASVDIEAHVRAAYLRYNGNLLEAVRMHRALTGSSLKEAKDWCDARAAAWSVPYPGEASS